METEDENEIGLGTECLNDVLSLLREMEKTVDEISRLLASANSMNPSSYNNKYRAIYSDILMAQTRYFQAIIEILQNAKTSFDENLMKFEILYRNSSNLLFEILKEIENFGEINSSQNPLDQIFVIYPKITEEKSLLYDMVDIIHETRLQIETKQKLKAENLQDMNDPAPPGCELETSSLESLGLFSSNVSFEVMELSPVINNRDEVKDVMNAGIHTVSLFFVEFNNELSKSGLVKFVQKENTIVNQWNMECVNKFNNFINEFIDPAFSSLPYFEKTRISMAEFIFNKNQQAQNMLMSAFQSAWAHFSKVYSYFPSEYPDIE